MPSTAAATTSNIATIAATVAITTAATSVSATTTLVTPNINPISDTFASNDIPIASTEIGATAAVNIVAMVTSTAVCPRLLMPSL